jgi:hypothetical protein
VACSHRLTTRKRGERVQHSRSPNQLHQLPCLKPGITLIRDRVLQASVSCDYSGAYYSKTGSVSKSVSPRASFTKSRLCGFCFETHFDSLLLTTRKWGLGVSNQVCYCPPTSYNSKKGCLVHRGRSTTESFVESLQLDNGG